MGLSYESIDNCGYAVGLIRLDSFDVDYESIDFFSTRIDSDVCAVTIYDCVDSYFRVAEIILSDRYSLREYAPLTGNEIVTIRYKNLTHSDETPDKIFHFFIVNIQEVQNKSERDIGSNNIKMVLVEAPIYFFLTANSVYKTYSWDGGSKSSYPKKSKIISDLLYDCLLLVPHIEKWYNIDIEKTSNTEDDKINFYIPNWTPFKTLNYLRKFAINEENDPYYVFYVKPPEKLGKKPTIVMKSIYSLMKEKGGHNFSAHFANQTYRPALSNSEPARKLNQEDKREFFDMTNVYYKRYITYFNRMKTSFSKMSGETFFTFDYINDNKYIAYTFDDWRKKYKGLGNYFIYSSIYGNQWSRFRPHSFTEPKRLVSSKLNEFAYDLMHSSISSVFQMPVNENRLVGQMADVLFKSANAEIGIDLMFSGRWLIWGQVDSLTIVGGSATSFVYCIKDGFEVLTNVPKGITKIKHLSPVE